MKTTRIILVTAAVVSGALIGAPTALAQPEPIVVTEHATTDTVTDIGAKGDSVGDQLTFANNVFDTSDRQVGTSTGVCTRVVVGAEWDCGWTLTLPQGQILVQGPYFDKSDSVLAITGGTGLYSGARGEMDLAHIVPDDSRYRFTYRIA